MYDDYRPFDIACPDCEQIITGWRGWDGPGLAFTWQQDSPHPISHDEVHPQFQVPPEEWPRFRLPDVFMIEARHGAGWVTATGVTELGTWRRTYLHHSYDYGCPTGPEPTD